MDSDMETDNPNANTQPGERKEGGFVQDINTNRQTLNTAEFSDSQPHLVTSQKSFPSLDLGKQQTVTSTDPIVIPRGRPGKHTPCSSPVNMSGIGSPCGGLGLPLPSPIITKRIRTPSTCERAMDNPIEKGKIRYFSRTKGHGFIANETGGDDIFLHISDIEGEYIPSTGDEVTYRLCPIPPKLDKFQAIHVQITHFTPDVHKKWDSSVDELEKTDEDSKVPSNLVT